MIYKLAVASFIISLVAISIVDFFTKSIYDWMLFVAAAITSTLLYFAGAITNLNLLIGYLIGYGFYVIIYGAAYLYYKREAFGYGDVLLNAYICGVLAHKGLISPVIHSFLTFFIAFAIVIFISLIRGRFDRHAEIPLAPAMAISGILTFFFNNQIIGFLFSYSFG